MRRRCRSSGLGSLLLGPVFLLLLLLATIPKSQGAECEPTLSGNNNDNVQEPVESKGLTVFVNADYIQTFQPNEMFLASMPHEVSLVVVDESTSAGTTIQQVWMRFQTNSNTNDTEPMSEDRLFGVAPGTNTILLSECEDMSTSVLVSNSTENNKDSTTTGDRFSGYLLMTQPGQLSLQVTVVFQPDDNAEASSTNDSIVVSSTYELSFVASTMNPQQNITTTTTTLAPSFAVTSPSTSTVPPDLVSSILDDNTTSTTSSSAPPSRSPAEINDANSNITTISPSTLINSNVDSTAIDQMVENLRLDLRISFNGELDAEQWEDMTLQWFEGFYENYNYSSSSSSDNTTDMDSDNEKDPAWGVQDMRTEIQLVRIESQNPLVILYDQRLVFTQLETEDSLPVLQYTTLPFRSRSGNAAYADLLQTELSFQSTLPRPILVPQILGPAGDNTAVPQDDNSSNGISKGGAVAIVFVVIAIVLGVAFLGYSRYQSYRKSADGPAFNMATFSFGHNVSSGNESPLTNDEESMEDIGDGDKYTVYAPSGKLGLVFDTFDDSGPMVCIVHESSPLFHRVQVGDRLIGVDEVNVMEMSPTKVCRLLGQRSRNPIRKLTLVRKIERPEESRRSKRYR